MKDNVLLGIVGAILGALLGSVLWILIGQIGFIAGIAGYAIVFCSVKGYEKLGGCVSRKGLIICIVFSFLMIVTAEFISTGIIIYRGYNEDASLITLSDAMRLVPRFFRIEEFKHEFIKEVSIGYALAIWASGSFVRNLWREIKEGICENNTGTDGCE